MLNIYAGKKAYGQLTQHGFTPENFTHLLGASGGPKWFVLFGLDKYLFGDYFKHKQTPLNVLGSSSGAFRAACFAQKNPVAAIVRFAEAYLSTGYSKKPSPKEVTHSAKAMIDAFLGQTGIEEILSNTIININVIATKVKGLATQERQILQFIGLAGDYCLNRISRTLLRHRYERVIFHAPTGTLKIKDPYHINTHYITLSKANIKPALLASGSIPLVLDAVQHIPGAPNGHYFDGGLVDYHFDLDIKSNQGLTLYPHFTAAPKAGWFDKNLNRSVLPEHYDNVVMLVPSPEFIHSLPHHKIPDRKDFKQLSNQERVKAWQRVLAESERLADCFHHIVQKNDLSQVIMLPSGQP